jgi:hypothetical protein
MCIFISKRISNTKWTAVIYSPDLNTVTIEYDNSGEKEVIYIYNIYNPPINTGESIIPLFRDILRQLAEDLYIVVGDFNLYYLLWGGEGNPIQDYQADSLLQLIGDYQMELLLPPGSIIYNGW